MSIKLRSMVPMVALTVSVASTTACAYALMTGKLDRPSQGWEWGPVHAARFSPLQVEEFDPNIGPKTQWRILTTPAGGHAVIGISQDRLTLMIDVHRDPRYFLAYMQEKPCATPPGRSVAGGLLSVRGTLDIPRRAKATAGPWTRRQIAWECHHAESPDHIMATKGAAMVWMMHVVAGEKATMGTGGSDDVREPIANAVDLVMGNAAERNDS